MPRYIAFLRAINVGGHTVKMDRLRALFEEMSFTKVETFIASGNVLFDSRSSNPGDLEARIEKHLERALGYAVPAYLRLPSELADIVAHQPFDVPDPLTLGHSLYVGFLKDKPAKAGREKFMALGTDTDTFLVHGREYYWRCKTKMSLSKIPGPSLDKALGMQGTMRNVTTVRKLAAMTAR